jgi:uncharacterized membrane protein YphA (DoxX/SURF4 family)
VAGVNSFINFIRDAVYGNSLTLVIRIILGGLFLLLGGAKLNDPGAFGIVIARYDILPQVIIGYAAIVVPVLEMLIGLLLVIGYKTRAAAGLSIFLMMLFILFIAVNLVRGKSFDCGCLNAGQFGLDINERISGWLILRDLIFLAGFILLYRAERHVFSLENFREKMRLKNLEQTKYQ